MLDLRVDLGTIKILDSAEMEEINVVSKHEGHWIE